MSSVRNRPYGTDVAVWVSDEGTGARQQARGAEDLAAAIEEIASLADELQMAEA